MQFPNCSNQMDEVQKYGVDIDFCPRCKGVWLDRGEIEKITDSQDRYQDYMDKTHPDDRRNYFSNNNDQFEGSYHKKKRRGEFLEDLFDLG